MKPGRNGWIIVAVVGMAFIGACTPNAGTGTGGVTTTTMPSSSSNTPPEPGEVWASGDSLSTSNSWPGEDPSPIASVAVAGRGFVVTFNGPTIGENTLAAVDQYGLPSKIVIMGGVNDVKQAVPPALDDITAAMDHLESALVARGIEVVWATQPGWQFVAQLAPLNDWIRATRAHVVDCAETVASWSYTQDGTHLNEDGKQILHDCIRPQI